MLQSLHRDDFARSRLSRKDYRDTLPEVSPDMIFSTSSTVTMLQSPDNGMLQARCRYGEMKRLLQVTAVGAQTVNQSPGKGISSSNTVHDIGNVK